MIRETPVAGKPMSRSKFLLITILAGVSALALALLTPKAWRLQMYLEAGVAWALVTLLVLLACASVAVWRHWRTSPPEARRSLLRDVSGSLLLTAVLVLLVPGRALIEHDENNLVMTAQTIHADFSPATAAAGVIAADGTLTPSSLRLDKRGVMYPLMLNALAPWALDYAQAALWLNAGFGALSLLLLVRIARRFVPGPAAFAAALLLASFPMFTVSLRGGGFDLANTALMLLAVHLACSLWYQPARVRLALLVSTLAVLCQLRYETPLLATLLLGALLLKALWEVSARSTLLALSPLALAPALFRLAMPIDWELPGPWFKAWSSANVPDNVERLVAWALSPTGWQMGSPAIGGFCLLAALVYLVSSRRRVQQPAAFVLCVVPAVALTSVFMFSYWGQITLGITTRYFIYLAALLSVFASFALARLGAQLAPARAGLVSLSVAALWFAFDLQRSVAGAFWTQNTLWKFRDGLRAVVQAQYGQCPVVIGTEATLLLLTRGVSAVFPFAAIQMAEGGAARLQPAGIVAVALAFETSATAPAVDPRLLERIPQARLVGTQRVGDTLANLYQLYPDQPIDPAACTPRPAAWTRMQWDPAQPPERTWETFRDRWEVSNARMLESQGRP